MPVVTADKLKTFKIPPKREDRLRVAISHEFVELYRGDKDLRIGKQLCLDYNCEVVHLGTDIPSPADSRIFKTEKYPIDRLSVLPDNYYLLLMKSRLIVHRKGNFSLGGFFRWTPGIIKHLMRWQPDLILENPYLTLSPRSFMTWAAAKMMRIPLIYMDCGDILLKHSLKHKLVLPFEKAAVNDAAAVITYNKAGKKRFINKYNYPPEKIIVIPKPIDTERFNPLIDCGAFRKRFDLDGKFVVAYFGRLCTNKGAKYLLYAADMLRQRATDKDIKILFVGGNIEAGQSAEFKAHLNELNLDNVELTGMIPNSDMPEAYTAADAAIFPDLTNLPAFPTVLAESMAAGLPIVIGNKGWEDATPIVNRENGLIIEPANPAQLADSIELLKQNHELRQKIAANALRFAREKMDYDHIVRSYYSIFINLLNKDQLTGNIDHDKDTGRRTQKSAV